MSKQKSVIQKSPIAIFQCNNCVACDLHIINRVIATGGGALGRPILFVKDTSTALEATNGIAFTNKSAKLIVNMISNYRLLDYSIFTNLILCNTREFNDYDYAKCKHNIIKLLKTTDPCIVITFGKNAYEKMTGDTIRFRKNIYRISIISGRVIIPLEHLYIINRNVEVFSKTLTVFNNISNLIRLFNNQYIPVSYDYEEYIRL